MLTVADVARRLTKASALEFVRALDAKHFKEAWSSPSVQLRASTSLDDFDRSLQVMAKLYGPVASRKLVLWMYPAASSAPTSD